MTSVRRHGSAIWLTSVVVAGFAAVLVPRAARAQTYEGEAPPPPPEEDEAQAAMPPADTLPPAQAPDQDTFQRALSPYGRWVDTPEYGRVWVPNETDPDWQPYTDGTWVDTPYGWSFASADPWGWATYHYGRWGYDFGVGWFWVPGFVWSPAWVSWRYYPGYVCWSPYAPAGFVYARHWPGWVVVPGTHFTHPINRFRIPRTRSVAIVRAASPVARVASRVSTPQFRGGWGNGNVRAAPSVRPGASARSGGVRATHGFTRSSASGSNRGFRGTFNAPPGRSFATPAPSRGSSFGNSPSRSSFFGNARSRSSFFGNAPSHSSFFGNARSRSSFFGNAQPLAGVTRAAPVASRSAFSAPSASHGGFGVSAVAHNGLARAR